MEEKSVTTVYQLCVVSLMSALLCVLGPLTIPIGEVPISAATLVIYLAVYLLGPKLGTVSCIIYLMLGFAGLPVFSGYTGGVAKLVGPTGGYLVGYILLAFISGIFMVKSSYKMIWDLLGMAAGTAVLYLFGTVWFMVLMKCSFVAAMAQCVVPFLIGDLAKIVFAELIGREMRRRLRLAHLLP